MGRMQATAKMREAMAVVEPGSDPELDELALANGFESWSAYLAHNQKRRDAVAEARAEDPEIAQSVERLKGLRETRKALRRSEQGAAVDTFTALQRGYQLDKGKILALCPTTEFARLYNPRRGEGLFARRHALAANQYAYLQLASKVGRAAIDPAEVRVDGGGGGDTELALIRASEVAKWFNTARGVVIKVSPRRQTGQLVLALIDWVCLEGGRPLAEFVARDENFFPADKRAAQACKTMLIREGLEALGQLFGVDGG